MSSSTNVSLALLQAASTRGIEITHLKLQKLLYYCQGYSLALFGKPCFSESLQAWDHGPVCASVYEFHKHNRSSNIKVDPSIDYLSKLDKFVQNTIDIVLNEYGAIPALQLRQMTHEETPWKVSYVRGLSKVIPDRILTEHFQSIKTNLRLKQVLDAMQDDVDIEVPSEIINSDQFIAWIRS